MMTKAVQIFEILWCQDWGNDECLLGCSAVQIVAEGAYETPVNVYHSVSLCTLAYSNFYT